MNLLLHRILLFLPVFSCMAGLYAQDTSNRRLKLSSFYVQNGFELHGNVMNDVPNFRILVPESEILKHTDSGYSKGIAYGDYSGNYRNVMSIQVGFHPRQRNTDKINPNPEFRIGVSYFSGTGFSIGLYKETRKPYDTVQYPSGRNIYYDSVQTDQIGISFRSDYVCADFSLIFRTNAKARWNIYAGAGISGGISLNNEVRIHHTTRFSIEENNSFWKGFPGEREEENFRAKTNYRTSVYIPLGVDFRIGKKRIFWKPIHLFFEARPGINFLMIPDVTTFRLWYIQNSLGFRIKL